MFTITRTFLALFAYLLALPVFAFELKEDPRFYKTDNIGALTSPTGFIEGITSFFSYLFLALSIWFFFLAGYKYMTANGEAEKFTEARKNMVYAMIGLVVGLGAYAMQDLITMFLKNVPTGGWAE
ncbi:MAG: hypothetical protein HZA36_03060 [Parcubacteria group bacterium]|nr:hypothetical protein [Parcubacteria group bacterium]